MSDISLSNHTTGLLEYVLFNLETSAAKILTVSVSLSLSPVGQPSEPCEARGWGGGERGCSQAGEMNYCRNTSFPLSALNDT